MDLKRKEEALWVLEKTRHDLVENWFRARKDACERLQKTALEIAYAGADEHSPTEIVETISALAERARFNYLLAQQAKERHQDTWNLDVNLRSVDKAIEAMNHAADEIFKIEEFVKSLKL